MGFYQTYTTTSGDGEVWSRWTSSADTGTSTTNTATSGGDSWYNWNSGDSGTCSATTNTATVTWSTWVLDDDDVHYKMTATPTIKKTEEQKQAERDRLERFAQERKERDARAKAREEEKKLAEKRAKELLLDLIGKNELDIYNKTGRLFVKGNKFDYIIQKSGYIKKIEKEKIVDMCVHLDNRYKYPETDNVVAMKLAIEEDEEAMLKKANFWGSQKRSGKLPKAACM